MNYILKFLVFFEWSMSEFVLTSTTVGNGSEAGNEAAASYTNGVNTQVKCKGFT